MEFIKKMFAYIALLSILVVIAVYGIPLLKSSGNAVVDTGVNKINEVNNSVKN